MKDRARGTLITFYVLKPAFTYCSMIDTCIHLIKLAIFTFSMLLPRIQMQFVLLFRVKLGANLKYFCAILNIVLTICI